MLVFCSPSSESVSRCGDGDRSEGMGGASCVIPALGLICYGTRAWRMWTPPLSLTVWLFRVSNSNATSKTPTERLPRGGCKPYLIEPIVRLRLGLESQKVGLETMVVIGKSRDSAGSPLFLYARSAGDQLTQSSVTDCSSGSGGSNGRMKSCLNIMQPGGPCSTRGKWPEQGIGMGASAWASEWATGHPIRSARTGN